MKVKATVQFEVFPNPPLEWLIRDLVDAINKGHFTAGLEQSAVVDSYSLKVLKAEIVEQAEDDAIDKVLAALREEYENIKGFPGPFSDGANLMLAIAEKAGGVKT